MPDLDLSLYQKVAPTQIQSAQVLHALKILQVPSIELGREISEELAKNPLLEEVPGAERNANRSRIRPQATNAATPRPTMTTAMSEAMRCR